MSETLEDTSPEYVGWHRDLLAVFAQVFSAKMGIDGHLMTPSANPRDLRELTNAKLSLLDALGHLANAASGTGEASPKWALEAFRATARALEDERSEVRAKTYEGGSVLKQ